MKNNMKKMVISLDKDISRRALFFAQPHTEDIEIFSAINMMEKEKQETAWHFDPTLFLQHYQRWATRGEIGCVLSHLSVYQKLVEDPSITNDDYCLICEDDAQFCSDFSIQLASILSLPL